MNNIKPEDIEKNSFAIISKTLDEMGVQIDGPHGAVLKRVIHTTADFDYVKNLCFSPTSVEAGINAFKEGCSVITDTNMVMAGVSKITLAKSNSNINCYITDPEISSKSKAEGVTRATLAMEKAAAVKGNLIIAVGNAPTALLKLARMMDEKKIKPTLIIGVPVGFVNVVESKELIMQNNTCTPYIVARGNKGGSNVAAAILNALLYLAFPREMDK